MYGRNVRPLGGFVGEARELSASMRRSRKGVVLVRVASNCEYIMGQGLRVKRFGRDIGWRVIKALSQKCQNATDVVRLYPSADVLGLAAYGIVRSRRAVTLRNLGLVFPDKPLGWRRSVARQLAKNIARGLADLLFYSCYSEKLLRRLTVNGLAHFTDAVGLGRGVLLATGHVGVFPLTLIPCRPHAKVAAIAREPHDVRVASLLRQARDDLNVASIPDYPSAKTARQALSFLREGGAVMIAFDIKPGKHQGVDVTFLGRKTRMFDGIVRLAAVSGAPIVPVSALRDSDGIGHTVEFSEPLIVSPELLRRGTTGVAQELARLADWLSRVILANPTQWWWVHRRWS